MAYNNDQEEFPLPVNNQTETERNSANLLPRFFRTPTNKKFLYSTLDQLLSPGTVEKISAFYGRKTAKAFIPDDNYIQEVTNDRQNYQLEPVVLSKDSLGNVSFYKDYVDYVNQIKTLGGNTDNHSSLNAQEYYSWNPHIDWDKFVNFREYYWLPQGPETVTITGQQQQLQSTYTVRLSDNLDNYAYVLTPDGQTQNATITLYKGITYKFDIDTAGMPFTIKTARTLDEDFLYNEGVDQQSIEKGIITFEVGINTPDTLYYVSKNDINAYGLIKIASIEENSVINVEKDIVGKKTFTLQDGTTLSNGMKINFKGLVTPEKYATDEWYVEGVGEAIVLIKEQDLQVPNDIADENLEGFDAENFDKVTYEIDNPNRDIKDYIVIKRSSPDQNPWTRANKWVHKSVLQTVANYNGTTLDTDEAQRAKRPIIEFESGLKLYKFGTQAKTYVDVVDTFTTDVFSDIEGATGYNVDGIDLADGMRILITADTDVLVKNRIFTVKIINFGGDGDPTNKQISLVDTDDTQPMTGDVVLVASGVENQGKMYYYDGTTWNVAQEKTKINQSPLFDLFDENGISFSDGETYLSTNFLGNKLFSYRKSTGTVDTELGFALSYRNVNNVGDIVFDFNLLSESFNYQSQDQLVTQNTDVGYLKKYTDRTTNTTVTGWIKAKALSKQLVVRQYTGLEQVNRFAVDVYDQSGTLTDLKLKVYVNNVLKKETTDYTVVNSNNVSYVQLNSALSTTDSIVIKSHSSAVKNANGYYEMAINLESNPFNDNLNDFTFGEVSNHVESIVEQLDNFVGSNPGTNNLRDLGQLSTYGTKFVQHSAPLNLAVYHVSQKEVNVVKAIKFAQKEYDKFKKTFLQTAENSNFDGSVREHVDHLIKLINEDKNSNMPFYFSDMVPHGAAKRNTFTVYDDSNKYFALSKAFSMSVLSTKAVQVYLNEDQLVHGIDYTFTTENFCYITKALAVNDIVEIFEYESTDGNFVPQTPTKLGLYPKFKPEKYLDNTLINPVNVIQGHDGSITVAFDDYRDDLLLELENRIYNNIKIEFNKDLRNLYDFIPGTDRNTGYTLANINSSMSADFITWNSAVGTLDYTENYFYDSTDSFTYNYIYMTAYDGSSLPGFWRAVYKQAYDTDRPHSHPWEMLGFSEQPTWWNSVYGPVPYTSDNLILWEDLQNGVIREPGKKLVYDSRYVRTDLLNHLPVDENGELLSPLDSGYAENYVATLSNGAFKFGDHAPVENAWRRSSNYPFALLKSMILNRTAHTVAVNFDASRVVRSITDEIIYSTTKKRISLKDLIFPNSRTDENYVLTSGLVNYISNYIKTDVLSNYANYQDSLKNLTQRLGFKVKGFTEKEKFKLLLDSRSPLNQSNVFIPDENYDIYLNTSSPIDVLVYSGVIVEKLPLGFSIKGYDQFDPIFKYFAPIKLQNDPVKRVGGVSKSYIQWTSNHVYSAGQIVQYQNKFYIVDRDHLSASKFDSTKYTKLVDLPIEGGVTATFSRQFESKISTLNYGTVLRTQQEVVDFLLGYSKYLESKGFIFENFNQDINVVENWSLSAQEFMFWTTQNWKAGAVLSLSPGANKLKLQTNYSVADNIFDNFYDYAVLRADGIKFNREKISVVRQGNNFSMSVKNTSDGIYFVKIPLVQKEHVVVVDNVTVFNDVIYDLAPGYRQDRIKVIGYVASNWDGSLNVPGFVFDEVKIKEWQPYTDYDMSDVVKYKQFYYSADSFITGDSTFKFNEWSKLSEKPLSSLRPNFEYKTNQFGDFYDLDTDNFDVEQQKLAQHLIGYQKREYLQNIINDDVSQYKFYQGFLQDKGTKNALEKLFNSLASANKDSIEFYEEWAVRTGQYGAATGFNEVEYLLSEKKFKLNPQPIELTDSVSFETTNFIYKIKSNETYLAPEDYDHAPFPTKYFDESYVKTAGFVDPNDVNFTVKNYEDILSLDTTTLSYNQYVWVGFEKQSWNVYKHKQLSDQVSSVTESNNQVIVELVSNTSNIQVDEIISVTLNGTVQLFKVKIVAGTTITCYKNGTTNLGSNGTLGRFISMKLATLSEINQKIIDNGKSVGELLWIENDSNDRWVTLKNIPVWKTHQEIANPADDSSGDFSRSIAVDAANTSLAVADLNNAVYIYKRASNSNQYTLKQKIDTPTGLWTGDGDFGASMDISADGRYLIVGAPAASNLKTNYVGDYVESSSYDINNIVRHSEQLWRVVNPILGEDPSVDFTTFDSAAFVYDTEYNSTDNLYPDIKILLRGDYVFPAVTTNHMLIRTSANQYRGSAVGDKLQLIWNDLTTQYPTGNDPFDGNASGIDKAFIDGNHVIQHKVDEILNIDLTIIAVTVGDVVETNTAEGTVCYVRKEGTQSLIYLSNVNGKFEDSGSLTVGILTVGDYNRVIAEDYDSLGGWWYINLGFTLTSTELSDSKKSLVVRDIIKAAESRTVKNYYNILDTQATQAIVSPTAPTAASEISILSYYKQFSIAGQPVVSGIQNDNRYLIRTPKTLSNQYTMPYVSDSKKTGVWLNTIRTGDPLDRYDISDISQDLTFEEINSFGIGDSSFPTKKINDIWNGWIRILAQADGLGTFYVPQVGNTIEDSVTGSQAEVTYVKTIGFNTLQIYIKNKTGDFSLGSTLGDTANIILKGTPDRTVGVSQRSELENSVTGSLFVFEAASLLEPQNNTSTYNYVNGLEYWFWDEDKQDGVARSASIPSEENRDYVQVFNIPVGSGTASAYSNEGAFLVYERSVNGTYSLYSAYSTPDSTTDAKLGTKIKISQSGNETTAFVSDEFGGSGRIYFIKNNSSQKWHLGINPQYTGTFDVLQRYYTDDLVIYNEQVYKSTTNQGPSAFDPDFWTLQTNDIEYLGHVPNDSGITLDGDSSLDIVNISKFATDFDVSSSGGVLVASVNYTSPNRNKVVIYKLYDGRYQYRQTISPPDVSEDNTEYAFSVAVSSDGKFIAVGSPAADTDYTDMGLVYVYQLVNGSYVLSQTLSSPQPQTNEQFGKNLDFDGNTLVVSSVNRLDESSNVVPSGSVYIYENSNDTFLYAETFEYSNQILADFGRDILISNNHVYVSLPNFDNTEGRNGLVVNFRKNNNTSSWLAHKSPVDTVDLEKIKGIFLYNTKTNELLNRLDYIDPIQGKIAGLAEQELYYKTYYDPAVYTLGTAGVSVDVNNSWSKDQVGRLWWDLSTVKFYDPYQVNIIYTTNYWNKIFPGSSIDVYEWVESKYTPSQWNKLADTKEGTAVGISGTTKYGNTVYVSRQLYDSTSESFSTRYYYWVKNKKVLPNIEFRKLSAYDVAQLIEDPKKQSYKFVALIANNKFSLHNCNNLMKNEDVAINFRYWTIDNQNINIHNEYQLISEGVSYSQPKKEIESVWFNSLIGYDENFKSVPDVNLSVKYRYGTLRKPRQSWFVNKTEALKQVIERINDVLLKNQIASSCDLTRLTESEKVPSTVTRLFDSTKDTLSELQFINTNKIDQTELKPIIQNGKIVDVTIINSGYGYNVVPTYEIIDTVGSGAKLTLTIDALGKVNSVTVNQEGSSYTSNARIVVRKYSVLINSDSEVNNKWAIHSWNEDVQQWQRVLSQRYDVNQYWNYVDWYADGYNHFTEIDHTVSASYQLQLIDDVVGDVVKIENIGTGGWLLLEKIDNQDNVDYTINYKTIGRQNGTIQFTSGLYDTSTSTVGYNSTSFDVIVYDNQPVIETRTILETVRDYIFIDELTVEYNKLFFSSLRYVFNEQLFVDWAFKTSFVKATHNVGELTQKTVYKNDNLSNYQDYINEVKPYKTKVREYISAYEATDQSQTLTTDFDLPATYDSATNQITVSTAKMVNDQIVDSNLTENYPNKHWLDHVGFKVTSIKIATVGSGYLGTPTITITGGGGTGATARAFVSNGRLTNIQIIDQGSGYLSAPTVNISGSLSTTGVAGKAVAILGDSLVKSTHIRVKFDRTTGTLLITNLSRTETFTSNGSQIKYPLKWPINLKSTKVRVIVNQRPALFSEYTYNNEQDITKSYVRSKGYIQFVDPPVNGYSIEIQYEIDSNVLQTQDRVNLLYEPTTGQLGTDLAQLIDGIDYGGVEVRSFEFGGGGGFDDAPYYTGVWDSYDTTYDDEVFRLDGSTNIFNLSQPLVDGVTYNIYKNSVRIDDPNYGTAEPVTNPNALMQTIQGDGSTTVIHIDEQLIPTVSGDIIVIRKSTSDGSFLPDPDAYDTLLSGGDLGYSTATGILAQDIIVDGDGFVTPTTSKGPEELVPGQVLDTLDIQVYDRSGPTGSRIYSYNHIADGINNTFNIQSLPQSQDAVFVKVNNTILDNTEYSTDFENKTVILDSTPTVGSTVNIVTMGMNGEKIVDIDTFTGDGSTFIFVTRAEFNNDYTTYVRVNGEPAAYVVEETDSGYQTANRTLIRFGAAPAAGSVISYVVYASSSKTFSEVTYDDFVGDGSTKVFSLNQSPFNQEPLTHNVIVKVDNIILNPGYNESFVVTTAREYELNNWQQPTGSVLRTNVRAFLNGVELGINDYTWSSSNTSITLRGNVGIAGDILKVYVTNDGEYIVNSNVLTLDVAPTNNANIKVWQFSNHDILQIERINYDVIARENIVVDSANYFEYKNLTNGLIRLRRGAEDAQYVWVIVNGQLLSPSIDYRISNNQQYVKINRTLQQTDVVDIIHFAAPKYVAKFGFRQFKDMLNRTHYKRLGNTNKYYLSQELHWHSQAIYLESTEGLTEPNISLGKPGIVFIDGERIEYFIKANNKLEQLRRGTLGTGIKDTYSAGTELFDQSAYQTVPYKDETITETFEGDGSTESFTLPFVPNNVNEFEVFVGGRRLRKNSIQSYNATLGMDSPEADVTLPAEFSVTGTTPILTLLTAPAVNTKVIVVKKIGKLWNTAGISLSQTENEIARFLRAKEVSLPQ